MIFLSLVIAMACELPHLPLLLEFFSPRFNTEHRLEASGKFISTNMVWDLEISIESLIRLTAEPKRHTIELLLTKESSKILYSESQDNGIASISSKINPGSYKISISIKEINSEYNKNIKDCGLPSMYLNIGIIPYNQLKSYTSKQHPDVFPDLSEITQSLDYDFFLTKTYENLTIPANKLSSDVLFFLPLKVDEITDEMRTSGLPGLWEITFALRNF